MELQFPVGGLHEGVAAAKQPLSTSPSLNNIRPYDGSEDRYRGGQRPGLEKAYTTQVVGDNPVIGIISVATTYITPA